MRYRPCHLLLRQQENGTRLVDGPGYTVNRTAQPANPKHYYNNRQLSLENLAAESYNVRNV